MDKAVALGLARHIERHLARQNVAECAEGIVQRLVVNGLVQVLRSRMQDTLVKPTLDMCNVLLSDSHITVACQITDGLQHIWCKKVHLQDCR